MRNISVVEAANIIGGQCKTCDVTYEMINSAGASVCKQITTCTDKHGTTTTMQNVDVKLCDPPPNF